MKRKRMLAKKILCMLLAVLLLGTMPTAYPEQVQAASRSDWKSAYVKILNNWKNTERYYDSSYLRHYFGSSYRYNQYFLYDLDKDNVPELFLYSTTMRLTLVFTYKKGLTCLGYFNIHGINTAKKEIIEKGHWHGAGGSNVNEWYIYQMNGSRIRMTYRMDIMNGYHSVNGNAASSSEYWGVYRNHISSCTTFAHFKKYRLSDRSCLNRYSAPGRPVITSVFRAGNGKLRLTWKKVPNVSGYQIYRSTNKNTGYRRIRNLSGKSYMYTDSRLKNGKNYYYKIRAFKKIGSKTYYGSFSSYRSNSPSAIISPVGVYKRYAPGHGTITITVYQRNKRFYAKAYGRGGKLNTTLLLHRHGERYTAYYFNNKKNGKFFEISSIRETKAWIGFYRIKEFSGWYTRK